MPTLKNGSRIIESFHDVQKREKVVLALVFDVVGNVLDLCCVG